MRKLAFLGVLALGFVQAVQAQTGRSAAAPEVEAQAGYVRDQLAGAGFREVPGNSGTHRFEGNAPSLTVVLLEPKRQGSVAGQLSVLADHPDEAGRPRIRESRLSFATPEQLAIQLQAVKAGFAESRTPVATAAKQCPFSRLLNRFVGAASRSHGIVGARQAQPVSLGTAVRVTQKLEDSVRWGRW